MKYLEELEKKVMFIVAQNKELTLRCKEFEQKVDSIEEALLTQELIVSKKNSETQQLEEERSSTQDLVQALLATIESLEKVV